MAFTRKNKAKLTALVYWAERGLRLLLLFVASIPSTQATSFDCKKAATQIEKWICSDSRISELDDEVETAYLRALERTDDEQKVVREQRRWLKEVRNACRDADCVWMAYLRRIDALDATPTRKCYTLEPPLKDENGKRPAIEPICRVVEKNLNRFCDQPPMVCGFRIAPEFRDRFTLPQWTPLDPEANRALIEDFMRAPWQDAKSMTQEEKNKMWELDRPDIEKALAEKRLTFSQAELDLYNLGKRQTAYRLDYGNCEANNPQLKERDKWGWEIQHAPVKIQHAPEIIRLLFKRYDPLHVGIIGDVFLYAGQIYTFVMHGKANPSEEAPPADNWLIVNRYERWAIPGDIKVNLRMNNVCIFNYQPIQKGSK